MLKMIFRSRNKGYKKGLLVSSSERFRSEVEKKYFPLRIKSDVNKYSLESESIKIFDVKRRT